MTTSRPAARTGAAPLPAVKLDADTIARWRKAVGQVAGAIALQEQRHKVRPIEIVEWAEKLETVTKEMRQITYMAYKAHSG